jgi:isocitrate dehydrogenase (NAD+)
MHRVTVMPGDGSGPELVSAATRVLEATGVGLDWDVQPVGQASVEQGNPPLPQSVLESLVATGVGLKGPVTSRAGTAGAASVNVAVRRELDLFAQARPARFLAGIRNARPGVDVIVMRETTEDLYAGVEFFAGQPDTAELLRMVARTGRPSIEPGAAVSLKPVSEARVRRFLEFAFRYARGLGRRRVTAVHKATAVRATDGLFLEVARDVARSHRELEFDDRLIDSLCADLVRAPEDYDVLVTTNLYGDILSDLTAALVGGVGMAPGANYGDSVAVFEPGHGSAPRHAGSGRLNPIGLVLSGALMLRHLEEAEAADRLERAVAAVAAEGRTLTYDVSPPAVTPVGTDALADAIIAHLG